MEEQKASQRAKENGGKNRYKIWITWMWVLQSLGGPTASLVKDRKGYTDATCVHMGWGTNIHPAMQGQCGRRAGSLQN